MEHLFSRAFQFQLLDVVPVARGALVERMRDGLWFWLYFTGLDINIIAQKIIGPAHVGQKGEEVLEKWPDASLPGFNRSREIEIKLGDNSPRFFDVPSPRYKTTRELFGRMVLMRD